MRKYLLASILLSLTSLTVGCDKKQKDDSNTQEDNSIFFALKKQSIEIKEDEDYEIEYVCYQGNSPISNPEIDFKVGDDSIASLNGKVLKGKKEGQTTLTASYSSFTYTIPVDVNRDKSTYSVNIIDDEYYLYSNESKSIAVDVKINNQITSEKATYTSSNEEVVEIDANGKLTPKGNGVAIIQATYKNASDSCKVYVETANEVYLDSYDVKVALNEEKKIEVHTDSQDVKYVSSDETICKIANDGSIIPVSVGSCKARIKVGSAESVCDISIYDYAIKTVSDFMAIQDDLTSTYYLANDIDFSGVEYVTIAHYDNSLSGKIGFDGIFDGNGKTIKNLDISYSAVHPNSNALFGVITINGVVKNLNLEISGQGLKYSGAICNINNYGLVEDCYVKVLNVQSLDDSSYAFGGIADQNRGAINNCIVDYSSATLSGNIAGIIGKTYPMGTVSNCFVIGSKVDNIIFNMNGSIIDTSTCYNVSKVADIYKYDLSAFEKWKLDYENHTLPRL